MTLGEVLLTAMLLAGTIAFVRAHRSGRPFDLWLELCGRERRVRSLPAPSLPEVPRSPEAGQET